MAVNPAREAISITGLGAFGAAGRNCRELWENCRAGRSLAQSREFDGIPIPVYAAPDPALSRGDAHLVRSAGRSATLALAAAREAWDDAPLGAGDFDPTRVGLILGSSRGPADVVDQSMLRKSKRPSEAVYTAFSGTAGILASTLNIQGCALSISATCTSGASAIYTAMQFLRAGELDLVLAGGVDAPLIDSILQRMAATGVLSSSDRKSADALRPFDLHRDGTVLGEGAAFLVLESPDSVKRRKPRIRGKLLGAAISCEPNSRSRPTQEFAGLQRAVRASLPSVPLSRATIDLVHLHGTGTRVNDHMESVCVHHLFGPPNAQPVCWGTKGLTGHTLGAASSFQAVLTLLAMRHSFLPATQNCSQLDPTCPIHLQLSKGSDYKIETALCLTSGFWGKNSSLFLGCPDP
jgi:3-oxoacyl-[acyl-carrier-protein] synthase II